MAEGLDIWLSEGARTNLENMQKRCWAIASQYGITSQEYLTASESLHLALMQLLRFGGKIYAEDDLTLIVQSYITLGIIWHGKRDQDNPLLGEWSVHS